MPGPERTLTLIEAVTSGTVGVGVSVNVGMAVASSTEGRAGVAVETGDAVGMDVTRTITGRVAVGVNVSSGVGVRDVLVSAVSIKSDLTNNVDTK